MNNIERRYQIFISSTFKDLESEREAVIKAILQNYHFPIGMEMFHADDSEQWKQISKTIDMSDFYVVIIGNCCGTLIESENISYTEKEYDYAKSKGIPILAFVIDPNTPTKHFEETENQRKAFLKFREKVDLLPRMTWKNKDDLALKVITTLHAKIAENNRNGWIQYNPYMFINSKAPMNIVGEYTVIYFSGLNESNSKIIKSSLTINSLGYVTLLNNIKSKNNKIAEFTYYGVCEDAGNIIYIHLKNNHSDERAMISLINPVGNLERFIGLFTAASSNNVPVCVKLACIKKHLEKKIDYDVLSNILTKENISYSNSVHTIEEKEKMLFYSDNIFKV